jgi:hypothetical protein
MPIVEYVFMSERDARDAAKEGGGTWVKRLKHKGRRVQLQTAKEKS